MASAKALATFVSIPDRAVMRRVHRWRPPRWFQMWMLIATRGGDGWLWAACGLSVLMFGGDERFRAIETCGMAAATGILLFLLIKRFAGRTRPCQLEPHCWYSLLPPDRFSFPSGHTLTAWAIAVTLGGFYPYLLPFLLFAAISVGASRVVLGMHFLSDVLAGSAIGTALGVAALDLIH